MLALVVGVLVALTPTPSSATTHVVPMRADQVTGSVVAAKVFQLGQPADHIAVY